MFSTTEHFSRAARALFDAQAAFFTSMAQGQLDAMRGAMASSTVMTRQWMTAAAWPAAADTTTAPRAPQE